MTYRICMFKWREADGAMILNPNFRRVAKAQFVDGQDYPLEIREQRSSKEHNFYFASINEAWIHLSDESREKLNSPGKLRKYCLIEAGWCDQSVFGPIPYRTALKWAESAATFFRRGDDYAEIVVRRLRDEETNKLTGEALVIMKAAKSQSYANMNKEDFRNSKRDVLDILSRRIEVKRSELERAGKEAAE